MNIVEKILSRVSGKSEVHCGDILEVTPDFVMSHDGDNIYNIESFEQLFHAKQVKNPERIIMGLDHNVPSNSIDTAKIHATMRSFAKKHGISFYEQRGVLHQLMIENHVKPYQLIFAADSHTCSYGALGALGIAIGTTDNSYLWATGSTWLEVPEVWTVELTGKLQNGVSAKDIALSMLSQVKSNGFSGKAIQFCGSAITLMGLSQRITLCNMAAEGGAFTAIIDPESFKCSHPKFSFDVSGLSPMVALPHSSENSVPVEEAVGTQIDEIFIGSCTNGRLEDFEVAAEILGGRKISENVRLYICPASQQQLSLLMEKGILGCLRDAGAILLNPGCSLCFGSCQGLLYDNESLLTTGNRNFKARVGSDKSRIYIVSPATAAASALNGKITNPQNLM